MSRYRGSDRFCRYTSPFPLRRFINGGSDIIGQGTVISQPADFVGYLNVDIVGLRISGITVLDTTNTTPRRMTFSLLDQVEYAGGRTLTTNAVRPFQDFQYTWNVTYADGSPIPNNEGTMVKGEAFNEYTDQRKGNCTVLLREPGSYKVVATVMAANGTGFVRTNTFEYEFTVEASTLPVRWVDFNNGLSTNDGLDAWGLSLSTATYTDSTRRIVQTGAFAGYDHAAATADHRVTYQYNDIYLSGATEAGFPVGLYKIASKISDDEIELVEALGADYTNVTSSTGPVDAPAGIYGFDWRITGNYVRSSALPLLGAYHIIGYGPTKPVMTNSQTNNVVITGNVGASGSAPANHQTFFGNIIVDGQWANRPLGTALVSSGSGSFNYIFDDVDFINNQSGSAVSLVSTNSAANILRHSLLHNCYINNLYSNRFEYTSAGNASGVTSFVINETIDAGTPLAGKLSFLNAAGRTIRVNYSSHDGVNTFTLAAAISSACASGNLVVSSDRISHSFGLSISSKIPGWRSAVLFCRHDSDGDDDVKDHHIYPEGYLDWLDVSYNSFEKGIGINYAINGSYSSEIAGYEHRGITFVGNDISDSVQRGFDASKTNNDPAFEWGIDLLIAENLSKCLGEMVFYYSTHNLRVAHNTHTNIHADRYDGGRKKLVHRASFTSNELFKAVVDKNVVDGSGLVNFVQNETGFEITANEVSVTGDNIILALGSSPLHSSNVIDLNNLYAPAQPSGYVATYGSTGKTLIELNSDFSATNISQEPL